MLIVKFILAWDFDVNFRKGECLPSLVFPDFCRKFFRKFLRNFFGRFLWIDRKTIVLCTSYCTVLCLYVQYSWEHSENPCFRRGTHEPQMRAGGRTHGDFLDDHHHLQPDRIRCVCVSVRELAYLLYSQRVVRRRVRTSARLFSKREFKFHFRQSHRTVTTIFEST